MWQMGVTTLKLANQVTVEIYQLNFKFELVFEFHFKFKVDFFKKKCWILIVM